MIYAYYDESEGNDLIPAMEVAYFPIFFLFGIGCERPNPNFTVRASGRSYVINLSTGTKPVEGISFFRATYKAASRHLAFSSQLVTTKFGKEKNRIHHLLKKTQKQTMKVIKMICFLLY